MPQEQGIPILVENLPDDRLDNLIENLRNKNARDQPLYAEALRERERRRGKGLDFETSFSIVRAAAEKRRYLSYKDLADASGADWSKVHYQVGPHLLRLVEYAHVKGWPMLSAIVVNKANVESGKLDPGSLKGFVAAARALKYSVADPDAFLKEQQERVFEWAKTEWD